MAGRGSRESFGLRPDRRWLPECASASRSGDTPAHPRRKFSPSVGTSCNCAHAAFLFRSCLDVRRLPRQTLEEGPERWRAAVAPLKPGSRNTSPDGNAARAPRPRASRPITIAHDHVRRAVAPGCFHPIREAAAGKTLQSLDSEWGPQHIAAQIFQLCTLMRRQAHIRMNAESIDIGATPRGWFRLLRFSAAAPGADTFTGVRPRSDAPTHTV